MHDPIRHAIEHIFYHIPKEILIETFIPKHVQNPNAIDFYIERNVITKVLNDCNLGAGKIKKIVLTTDYLEDTTIPMPYSILSAATIGVYRIPPEMREYRDISSVIEIGYPYSAAGFTNLNYPAVRSDGQTAMGKGRDMLSSHSWANTNNPPRPILLSGDLIRLDPPQFNHIDYLLTCILKFDKNFTNLNVNAIMPLSELILCATKIFIFNHLVLKIDQARISGGQELGRFREIVDEYANEHERYPELLLAFRGGDTLDTEKLGELISGMF